MSKKKLKRKKLAKILRSFGVAENTVRGKGGHTMFSKTINGKKYSYPIPGDKEVKDCYVDGARKKFKLTKKDGVSDNDFYGRA